jgi:hypothetical protein
MKYTDRDHVDQVTHAPATGIYRMGEDGGVSYQRFDYNRRRSIPSARPSSCASPARATIATRAPTWVSSSPAAASPWTTTSSSTCAPATGSAASRTTTPASPSSPPSMRPHQSRVRSRFSDVLHSDMPIHQRFTALVEDRPGEGWQALFERCWSGYRDWYLRSGVFERPSYLDCRRALRQHMPELVPVWERLVDWPALATSRRAFSRLWCPPAYIAGCSQGGLDRSLRPSARTGPAAQLRLFSGVAGGQLAGHPLVRSPGAGHGRLPVGCAGRNQRSGPGRVTELRWQESEPARASASRW